MLKVRLASCFLGLLTLGCDGIHILPKKKHGHKDVPLVQVKPLLGDPLQFTAGRTLNNKLISSSEIGKLEGYGISNITILIERDIKKDDDTKNLISNSLQLNEIEDENSTSDVDLGVKSHYTWKKAGNGKFLYSDLQNPDLPQFEFRELADKSGIELVRFFDSNVKTIHNSIKADGKAFSILVHIPEDPDTYGKGIAAVYFTKNEESFKNPEYIEGHHYLFGDDLAIGWGEGEVLNFSACGDTKGNGPIIIEQSLKAWLEPSEIGTWNKQTKTGMLGRTKINLINDPKVPFSDLNVNCVTFLDQYLLSSDEKAMIVGLTFPIRNVSRQVLVGANMFVLRSLTNPVREIKSQLVIHTTTHELGHAFGLGHDFTENNPESIMSYNSNTRVTDGDIEALDSLFITK